MVAESFKTKEFSLDASYEFLDETTDETFPIFSSSSQQRDCLEYISGPGQDMRLLSLEMSEGRRPMDGTSSSV